MLRWRCRYLDFFTCCVSSIRALEPFSFHTTRFRGLACFNASDPHHKVTGYPGDNRLMTGVHSVGQGLEFSGFLLCSSTFFTPPLNDLKRCWGESQLTRSCSASKIRSYYCRPSSSRQVQSVCRESWRLIVVTWVALGTLTRHTRIIKSLDTLELIVWWRG